MKPPYKIVLSALHQVYFWPTLLLGFLFLMLTPNSTLNAQEALRSSIDSIYNADQDIELNIEGIKELIGQQDTSNYTSALGYAYHRLGLLYKSNEDYQRAVKVTLIAANIRENLADIPYRDLDNSLFNVSVYLRKMGRAEEGEPYLKKVVKNNKNNKFHYRAINGLALLKAKKGDFFEALDYLDTLFQTINQEKFSTEFINANKYGIQIYSEMPHPERYFTEISKLEEHLKSYELDDEEMVKTYTNLGSVYSRMKENEKAITYHTKVERVYRYYDDTLGLGDVYTNLGIEYSLLGQLDKASIYYTQALSYANRERRADIYDNQGFYLHNDDPQQRLRLFQKAINTILDKEQEEIDINVLPDLERIDTSAYRLDILTFLIDKATAWTDLFEYNKQPQNLVRAKETLYLLDQLVSSIRLDSESEQSKLFWIDHGVDFYVLATKVCYWLQEPAEAFYFMEKNKSLLLLENLDKTNSRNTRMLATSSQEEAQAKHVSPTSSFVEFILNEKEGFGLFYTQGSTRFFELNDVPTLITSITRLKSMVERPFTTEEEFEAFDRLSHTIFKELFPFENALNLLADQQLIVIPDYELHNLPFEVLTTQVNKQSFEKNYLLKTTAISYLHSCSVEQRIDELVTQNENGMISFVPTIFNSDTLADLRLSEIEMKEIASFFPSQLVLREQATKASFIKSLDQYSIIHINSHAGYTQNSIPWLSFYDQNVNLEELSSYRNQSNLVILDACKSALGEQQLGEGIMSLARAFFYGGSASVIAAQWQVNEKSSGEIFKAFYKNLQAGKSKLQSLHQAKQAYLASNQLSQLSPYYWASFTLTGDAGHLEIEKEGYWMKVLLAVFVFLMLVVLARRFL